MRFTPKTWSAINSVINRKPKRKPPKRSQEERRKQAFRQRYRITLGDYDGLLIKQNGLCAICFRAPSGKRPRLFVDHCHKSNKIRGLLCSRCNTALGYLKDDILVLQSAIDYLKAASV